MQKIWSHKAAPRKGSARKAFRQDEADWRLLASRLAFQACKSLTPEEVVDNAVIASIVRSAGEVNALEHDIGS